MAIFTRILIAAMIVVILGTTYLASAQGWWLLTIRNPVVMEQYKKEQSQYRSGSGYGGRAYYGFQEGGSRREFRSGSRSSRGK